MKKEKLWYRWSDFSVPSKMACSFCSKSSGKRINNQYLILRIYFFDQYPNKECIISKSNGRNRLFVQIIVYTDGGLFLCCRPQGSLGNINTGKDKEDTIWQSGTDRRGLFLILKFAPAQCRERRKHESD